MKSAIRQHKIRQMLETQEFVDFQTLCRELDASESSIRRDLTSLEEEGILKRVYGGAMAVQASNSHLLDFDWQSARMGDEKRRIARVAAQLIEDDQTVILDGGSTVAMVARELVSRSLHVMTNSLPIADVFADARHIELTLTGGFLYPRLRAMVGPLCEHTLGAVTADVLIMGIGGITEAGFSNNNTLVVEPERKMIEVSRKVIVVTDHTKFGRSAMIPLAPLDIADIVVTDSGLAPEYRSMLEAHSVQVIAA
jgi:DeoR/GlpR family transcriptional regulator of sugar metabolism